MNHSAAEAFIEALKKWNEATKGNQAHDFETLCVIIGYRIGVKFANPIQERNIDKKINTLYERIVYLVENEKFSETFLISSLANYVTQLFKDSPQNTLENLLAYEQILQKHGEHLKIKEIYERQKSAEYISNQRNDYYRWVEIVATDLSEEKFRHWENEHLLEKDEKVLPMLQKMSEKYGNKTLKEIWELENNKESGI